MGKFCWWWIPTAEKTWNAEPSRSCSNTRSRASSRQSDEGRMAWDWRPTIEASPPLRRGVQTADRAVVRERQAIPGDQGRVRHRAIDPAALGPGHPRQRWCRGQPHARAERAGRAGEAQQAVGDGGGPEQAAPVFAGVNANAARYPISARCGIPGVPVPPVTGWPGIPGRSVRIRSPATCARSGATSVTAGARKIKAALERRGVTASRRRIGGRVRP